MGLRSITRPRVVLVAMCALALTAATSCTPTPDSTTPPALAALVTPNPASAGTTLVVLPPDQNCAGSTPGAFPTALNAAITVASTGRVISQSSASIGPGGFSEYTTSDPLVHVVVPAGTAPGSYLVYLTCNSYLGSYEYAPTSLTVT